MGYEKSLPREESRLRAALAEITSLFLKENGQGGRASLEPWDIALLAVVVTAGLIVVLADSQNPRHVPSISDEYAYLLQAQTLLLGRLALPAPEGAEFFEAAQVLVEPHYMAKYYPGHALFLAPFVAMGIPWLWSRIALAMNAGLVFLVCRRSMIGRAGATFAATAYIASPDNIGVFRTYLSHSTSTFLATVALVVAQAMFRRSGALRTVAFSAIAGLALFTRPYTGIAIAAAGVAGVILERRSLKAIVQMGAILLVAAGGILTLNKYATGDMLVSPWALWAKQYTPFDGPGIGEPRLDSPLREVPPHLEHVRAEYWEMRKAYTFPRIPHAIWMRARNVARNLPGLGLLLLVLLGVAASRSRPVFRVAGVYGIVLFALNVTHHANYQVYSCDLYPVLALLLGLGVDVIARILRQQSLRANQAALGLVVVGCFVQFSFYDEFFDVAVMPAFIVILGGATSAALLLMPRLGGVQYGRAALIFALALLGLKAIEDSRVSWRERQRNRERCEVRAGGSAPMGNGPECAIVRLTAFEGLKAHVAEQHGILFVKLGEPSWARYPIDYPIVNPGLGIRDVPVLLAVDRGLRNEELLRLYPERPAYVLHVSTMTMTRLR